MTGAIRFAGVSVLLLLITVGIADAQEIRKFVTPEGKIIYSDVPVPGAREVGEIAPAPEVDQDKRDQAQEAARREAKREQEAEKRLQAAAARQARIAASEAQLESARAALASGMEPRPGERIGTAGGNSRLTDAYFRRQKTNERAVEEAQKQLDAARANR